MGLRYTWPEVLTAGMLLLAGCGPRMDAPLPSPVAMSPVPSDVAPSHPAVSTAAQATLIQPPVGPGFLDVPPGVNPLTGLHVSRPALLDLPALLVSIPHFPPQARPQAGLSFAPWVFEYLISAGSTRLLAVFHGEYPSQEQAVRGRCAVRTTPILQERALVGNRVWLDLDGNGVQDAGERGIGGVCVVLRDATGETVEQETSTDSNGFYGFSVEHGSRHQIEFDPGLLAFSLRDMGDENHDSDADPSTGRTGPIAVTGGTLLVDAGLVPAEPTAARMSVPTPSGQVGPVRSARLINIHIHDFFQDSCLIYAGSTSEIRDRIPHCAEVFAAGDGGVGAMLDIARMVVLAEKNGVNQGSQFNYASNLFSEQLPPAGSPVGRLDVYVAELNQSAWIYDAAAQGWLRHVDAADAQQVGVLHADTDRLTGRQLLVQNLAILFVDHQVLAPAILDMHLAQGETGRALLFRDGQMFRIRWSTRAGEYEQTTGLRRPLSFIGEDGEAFPMHPGHTWIVVATPYSELTQMSPAGLRLRIVAPAGAGDY